ncbi:unnamed protein product, partial [Larinioides sclopetarius]
MASEKDPFQQAKEAEARIAKLQSEVQHVKQRIQLADSEERAETEEFNKKIKDNELKIKNLGNQLQKLQISRNKGLQEAKEILDDKVLDLIKKSNALTHELKMKERDLAYLKKQSKDVAWKTYSEFEVELLESDVLRRVRELENDYQKVEKNLM